MSKTKHVFLVLRLLLTQSVTTNRALMLYLSSYASTVISGVFPFMPESSTINFVRDIVSRYRFKKVSNYHVSNGVTVIINYRHLKSMRVSVARRSIAQKHLWLRCNSLDWSSHMSVKLYSYKLESSSVQ